MSDVPQQTPPPKPPPPPAAAREEDEIVERRTLRDYYIILRERFWIAFPLALLVSLGVGYYQSRQTPMYMSTATMQFEKPDRIVTTEGVTNPAVQSEIDINTNIEILKSDRLRERVIHSLTPEEVKILQRPYLKDLPPGASPPSAAAAMPNVDVSAVRNSLLIRITTTDRDPEAAKIIADKYVDQFMQYLLENVGGKNEYAVDWLTSRAEQLRRESEAAALKLQNFMQAQGMVSLDDSTNLITARLQAVSNALTQNQLQLLQLQAQYSQIQQYIQSGQNLLEIQAIATHGEIPSLVSQLMSLKQQQQVLAERYLERYPKMIDIANQISVAQSQLDKAIKLAVDEIKSQLAKTIDAEKRLEAEKAIQEKAFLHLGDVRTEYESLKNQSDVKRKNYMDILDRLNQTQTTSNIDKIPLRPLDRAQIAGAPYTPNMGRIIKTCTGLGVLVFLGVAVGLSFIDDRIKSAWDVEHFIGANLLGIIPEIGQIKDEDKYQLVLNNKPNPGQESFLSVYSSVKIQSKLDFPKSILVTSTIPGEGKTLVSCNLAGAFARHGRNTLLIDCDLRRPMLHRHYKQANNNGLISWYENGADLESDLLGNPHLGIVKIGENLSLLCSGGRSKTPSELLESNTFAQLLERLKRRFDLIVVDSPPLGAVTDSLLIAERIDEVIYVCRFNRAYRKHIKLYIKALRSGKNEILGIVLNGLSPRRIEYYSNYRYYRSYKKYYGAQT
ncbi:tyrosine-protein kinase CpsD [mine drainage metagenome]|uniref:Tyrosine-protein kinase CpsD n=1 Tax=mine drainage metagenome TaxID=410659 RepID=A0A1J5SPZ5_9ZZZZ